MIGRAPFTPLPQDGTPPLISVFSGYERGRTMPRGAIPPMRRVGRPRWSLHKRMMRVEDANSADGCLGRARGGE
jgi:hypothetical protein